MPAYAGKSADDGPQRPDVSAHVFQGGHSEMLKRAAQVTLWARAGGKAGARRVSLSALVTNVGSGHLMPTGIPGIRELWLDVRVQSSGAELFTTRANFGATLLDKDGKPAMPWRAVRVGTDTRIAPQRSRREVFQFTVPDGKPVDASATLYYRLISETAAKAAGISPTPPIQVAADRIQILPDGSVKKLPVQ